MKKTLLLLLFLPITFFAQNHYTQNDISTAAAHSNQWLLTNTSSNQMGYDYGVKEMVQAFIKVKTKWEATYSTCGTNCEQWVHKSNAPSNLKKRKISYKLYFDRLPTGERISKKVVFSGNKDLIIDFFMNYWTEDLEFAKGTKGEYDLASARFLTDIATLRIDKEGTASIVVKTGTAKDTFATTISYNE